jgi:hypothetical protein
VLARQALYYLSHAPGLFCSVYFENRVPIFAQDSLVMIPYFILLAIAGMIDVCHHTQPLVEVGS